MSELLTGATAQKALLLLGFSPLLTIEGSLLPSEWDAQYTRLTTTPLPDGIKAVVESLIADIESLDTQSNSATADVAVKRLDKIEMDNRLLLVELRRQRERLLYRLAQLLVLPFVPTVTTNRPSAYVAWG